MRILFPRHVLGGMRKMAGGFAQGLISFFRAHF
jgi:hypothetical protein